MPKKIHVIGANGYIGSLLIKYLRIARHLVDIADYRLLNIPEKSIDADIVIHLAQAGGGTVHKPRIGNDDQEYMRKVNIDGMNALLAGLKNKTTKIIYISSTAVYGKFSDSPLVNEESNLLPVSDYGRYKVESEGILKLSEFEWMILRPCGIFGPSIGDNFGNSFLNVVVANALKNMEVTILGGDQLIDTVYILDLINVILRCSNNEWHSRETYNVGGEIVRIKEMLTIVYNNLKMNGIPCTLVNKEYKQMPAVLTDSTKLKSSFINWTNTPLDCSIHALISAYVSRFSK
jgi:nucleoside-diphosphate-sugar epimerase